MASQKGRDASGTTYTINDALGKVTVVKSGLGGNLVIEQNGFQMILNKTNAQDLSTLLTNYLNSGGVT